MCGQTGRRARPRWLGVAAIGVALVLTTGCVGRPKEVHGQHRSFLSGGNGAPAAAPANTSGNGDTSGLGGGMLQSPDNPTATPTPQK